MIFYVSLILFYNCINNHSGLIAMCGLSKMNSLFRWMPTRNFRKCLWQLQYNFHWWQWSIFQVKLYTYFSNINKLETDFLYLHWEKLCPIRTWLFTFCYLRIECYSQCFLVQPQNHLRCFYNVDFWDQCRQVIHI